MDHRLDVGMKKADNTAWHTVSAPSMLVIVVQDGDERHGKGFIPSPRTTP